VLGNVDLFLIWALLTYCLYMLIPGNRPDGRFWVLLGSSIALVYMLAPWSLIFALYVTGAGFAWCRYHDRYTFRYFPYKRIATLLTLLGPLILIKILGVAVPLNRLDFNQLAISLGIGFLTLKTIAVVFDCFQKQTRIEFAQLFLLNIFFPIYSAGPIERYAAFTIEHFEKRPAVSDFAEGSLRLVLGLFKSLFVAETLIKGFTSATWTGAPDDFSGHSTLSLVGFILMKFFYTYVNFSGYMDIAIGTSRWFGLSIMENFNIPVLARNLQDFWRRWHISLGNFVRGYVFFPLLLIFKGKFRAQLAIFVSFMLIGLWHEFTLTYLAWGAMHGAGLAALTSLDQWKNRHFIRLRKLPGYPVAAWAFTIFYVAFVQTIANLPDLKSGWKLIQAMAV